MKAHFFARNEPISIISLPVTFKLACDTNIILEGAAMSELLFFMQNALASILNSRMSSATTATSAAAFVYWEEPLRLEKLLRSYPEAIN